MLDCGTRDAHGSSKRLLRQAESVLAFADGLALTVCGHRL